ncbi:protein TPX2-like isoform X2 [Tripterygium wilfordii]|uniref:protein TPX2-like isoform X2 n=1 Tax=Tripterygium wilfordii TaxID=458696 RepID=UPI0018F81C54|nr:protein TPX2-like isoform X2 [Tripterygium wilfordii]
MEEDMDMEVEAEMVFEAREIDLDYEFEAPRFFDFTREESLPEAREVKRWFESAKSYPPSPFVAKLVLREDNLLENVITSPKCKDAEFADSYHNRDSNDNVGTEPSAVHIESRDCDGTDRGVLIDVKNCNLHKVFSQPSKLATGLTFNNDTLINKLKGKMKSSVKPICPRGSTLMKPTASQLAKQNRPPQVGDSRYQTNLFQNERSSYNSSVVESQAAKRQKLEGGNLRKVADVKQQTDLVHKVPKKDGTIDNSSVHAKLKLTVPREPDLETAHRAQRMRPKKNADPEQVKFAPPRFKARPFNGKIFEAPSLPLPKKSTPRLPEFQEFHLKTLERAKQNTSTVSSNSFCCSDADKCLDKPSNACVPDKGKREFMRMGQNESGAVHQFKARSLNKKIFSSKGDLGVFRNSKRETTVPMDFNFHIEKRIHHHPPVELFSKLSLTSELQTHNGSQLKLARPSPTYTQGSKENRLNPLQAGHEKINVKEKPSLFTSLFTVRQAQYGSVAPITEAGNHLRMRNLGIR